MMSANIHFLEGKKAFDEGLFRLSVSLFSKAIEAEENPYFYYERAVSYIHLKKLNQALTDLNTACQLQPENPFRYSSRAYVKEILGDVDGAIEDYYTCIKIDPEDAVAYNNLGLLEEKKGRLDQAKKLVKQADKLAAKNACLKTQQEQKNLEFEQNSANQTIDKLNKTNKDFTKIIANVFTSKQTWGEFLSFVKNGFKLK